MKKIVIVTGCGGGIGNATATYFAENGWLVYGLDINHTLFSNPNVRFVQTDISDTENVQKTLDLISEEHNCLLYTSPSPRDATLSRMPSSA